MRTSYAVPSAFCARENRQYEPKFSAVLLLFALGLAPVLSLQGCGGASGSTDVKSISITPTSVSVPINTQEEFSATVYLFNSATSTNTTLSWEVNDTVGGDSTIGTIVASSVDAEVGIYRAPAAVPSSGVSEAGQVKITAVATTSSSTTKVTSNVAVVTIGAGLGFAVTPTSAIVPSGAGHQFTALLNSVADPAATWTVSSAGGGDAGTIDTSGLYTAPLSPPPGNSLTITATDGANTATATVTVVYSDHSLSGPYVFSYIGNDSAGLLAVAGSFVADGAGRIASGVVDFDSFLTGSSKQIPITGTYQVGGDGRGTAALNVGSGTIMLRFALITNERAEVQRFDAYSTGSGVIEQQNLSDLSNSLGVISGPYVFIAKGSDSAFHPMGVGGKFSADGAGNIPQSNTILDVNDNGIGNPGGIVTSDRTLQGSYQFDASFPGTGRGTLTLTSSSTGQRQYAFYIVDRAHLRLVEIDGRAYLAGRVVAAPTGNSFSVANLVSGNYLFTAGGNSANGSYAVGGLFVSNGSGSIGGGTLDANRAGTYNSGPALEPCPYTVDGTTGRIDLKLFVGSGTCPSTGNASLSEFAAYSTAEGAALMLEIDTNVLSTGSVYEQCFVASTCSSATPSLTAGSFALSLQGQGIFHGDASAYQQNVDGQLTLTSASISSGTLDIDNFNAIFPSDPVATTGSSVGSPSSSGRGTAVVVTTNPAATYNLIYYLVDDNLALLFDQDTGRVLKGELARQF